MRVGQKNKLTYRWARKGSRLTPLMISAPSRPICSVRYAPNTELALPFVLPFCNTEAMQLHLDEIATKVSAGAHAILILDQAGWHSAKGLGFPATYRFLHSRACRRAQLPREHLAVHATELAIKRIFKSFDDIVDHCCYAWNTSSINVENMSIAQRWDVVVL